VCARELVLRLPHRLDDEVDVGGNALGVRPQAYVHLGWSAQTGNHLGGPRQQRTHLSGLGAGQVGNVEDVALGLDNEGAHAEGPDAVLDQPVVGAVDQSARQRLPPCGEITRHAVLNARPHGRMMPEPASGSGTFRLPAHLVATVVLSAPWSWPTRG